MKPMTIGQTITERKDESLKFFLKDISKIPLLSISDEKELSDRIKKGDEEALNKLVISNLRFVVSIAKQYQNKGLSLVDLIQEGVTGLIKSAKTFDADKGFKFISYSVWWIRQAIIKAITEYCRTVRVPMNQVMYNNKVIKLGDKFEQEYGRRPEIEELDIENKGPIINTVSVSINNPFKEDDDSCLLDVLADNSADCPDDDITTSDISERMLEIIENLPYRDRDVIRMLFGLGFSPMQLEEVANRFGLSSERIRQIKEGSLQILKDKYSKELKELL